MKVENVLVAIVVLLLAAFAAIGAMNTMLAEKQAALGDAQAEADRQAAAAYWMRVSRQPRPQESQPRALVPGPGDQVPQTGPGA